MRLHDTHSDEQLMKRLQNDDMQAFEIIFETYWTDLYKTCYYRLQDQFEAEDLVQDVFTSLWSNRRQVKVETSLSNYLYASVKYKIIRLFNKGKIHQQAVDTLLYRMSEIEHTITDVLNYKDLESTISDTIGMFPDNMRKVFLLRAEDFTIREIADALGLAEQSVKNNVSEGLKRLKIVLIKTHPEAKGSFLILLASLLTDP